MNQLSLDFRFLELLGQGAEGPVYRVEHLRSQRNYAIKLPQGSASAGCPADLPRHPRLLPILARRRTADGTACVVMPLLRPLDTMGATVANGPAVALDLLSQAAAGLSCLHREGIVHGDLKPGNLMVESAGGDEEVPPVLMISDLDKVDTPGLARTGVSGTLGYMAPEVLDGHPVSPASDIYSLGAWFYWLITGHQTRPESDLGATIADTRRLVERARPWRTDERFAGLFWEDLLGRLLAPRPEKRFGNAATLLSFLSSHADLVSDDFAARLPVVAWNPMALTEGELCVVRDVSQSLEGTARPKVVSLRTARPEGASLILQEVSRRLSVLQEETYTIRASSPLQELEQHLERPDLELIIIDDVSDELRFQPEQIAGVIETCLAASVKSVARPAGIVILQSAGSALDVPFIRDRPTSLVTHSVLDADMPSGTWMDSLFSGLALSESIPESLGAIGIRDPASIREAFSTATQTGILRSSTAGVTLDNRQGRSWFEELQQSRERQLGVLGRPDRALWELMNRLPSGMAPALSDALRVLWSPFDSARARLRGMGFLCETSEGVAQVSAPVIQGKRNDEVPAPDDLLDALQILCGQNDVLREIPAGLRIELDLVAWPASTRTRRRALAYAHCLLVQRRPVDVLRLLRWGSDGPSSENHGRLTARAHQLRARAFNAIGHFREAVQHQEVAARTWRMSGNIGLAVECAVRAASWQQSFDPPEKICEYVEEARRWLRASREGYSARLERRLDAVVAFPLLRLEKSEEVAPLCLQILDDVRSDGFARSEASRVLSFVAERSGHQVEERSRLAYSVRAARRARNPESCARTLTSVASRELARGQIRKAYYVLQWLGRLDPGRIRPSDALSKLSGEGGLAFEYGDFRRALYLNVEALAVSERIGNQMMMNSAHRNLGLILFRMNRPGPALEHMRVVLSSGFPVRVQHSHPAYGTAVMLLEIGDHKGAREFLDQAAASSEWQGSLLRRGQLLAAQSEIASVQGDRATSLRLSDGALKCFRDGGAVDEEVRERLRRLGAFMEVPGASAAVQDELGWAEMAAGRLGTWLVSAACRLSRARHGEWHSAAARLQLLEELEADLHSHGEGLLELPTLQLRAEILIGLGRLEEAQDVLRRAIERIRRAAGELPAELRSCYLRDSRRQRFLDLIRMCRGG